MSNRSPALSMMCWSMTAESEPSSLAMRSIRACRLSARRSNTAWPAARRLLTASVPGGVVGVGGGEPAGLLGVAVGWARAAHSAALVHQLGAEAAECRHDAAL